MQSRKQEMYKDSVKKPCVCQDPKDLVNHICQECGIHIQDVLVRVGIDGGHGSLKVIMNIFDPADLENKNQKDSGVNKVIVLALVENVQESHHNMKIIFDKAKLNDLKYVLSSDLKLLNIIVGISAHGGKHCCLYCNGTICTSGDLRTIAMLKSTYERYINSGAD